MTDLIHSSPFLKTAQTDWLLHTPLHRAAFWDYRVLHCTTIVVWIHARDQRAWQGKHRPNLNGISRKRKEKKGTTKDKTRCDSSVKARNVDCAIQLKAVQLKEFFSEMMKKHESMWDGRVENVTVSNTLFDSSLPDTSSISSSLYCVGLKYWKRENKKTLKFQEESVT